MNTDTTTTACWCISCDEAGRDRYTGARRVMRRFCVCPDCGNKRCPRATHHDNPCSGSNAPGQFGSRYGSNVGPKTVRRALDALMAGGLTEREAFWVLLDDDTPRSDPFAPLEVTPDLEAAVDRAVRGEVVHDTRPGEEEG
jgi:hypothetical protein